MGSLLSGLQAYWRLSEPAGNPRVDVVGGLSLTETNGTVATSAGLRSTIAASFTKANYLKLAAAVILGGPFSLSCWVNPTDLSTYFLIGQSVSAGNGISISMTAAGGNFRVGSGATIIAFPSALTTGMWSHIVGTYDGTTQSLYINGTLQGTLVPASTTYGAPTFAIGAESNNGALIFNGLLAGCAVHNRTLSPAEVLALYNNGSGMDYPFTDGKSY